MKTTVNLFLSFFLLPHIVNAFNITQILNKYPEFSSFNDNLSKSKLSSVINSQDSVTVLVIENNKLFPVSGKPPQIIANILSVHIILDYLDIPKLQQLKDSSTTVTTLFQTTGQARGQQGFLNVTRQGTNGFTFGSSVPRPIPTSNLVKTVFTEAYNISVLQISGAILPPGIDGPPLATSVPLPPAISPVIPGGATSPRPSKPPGRPIPISPAASQTPGGPSQTPKPGATSPATSQTQPPATAPSTGSSGSQSTAPTSSNGSQSPSPPTSPNMSPRGSQITISPSMSQGNASTPSKGGGGGAPAGAADSPGATPGSSSGSSDDASSPASGLGDDASDSGGDSPPPFEEKSPLSQSKSGSAGRSHHGGLAVVCTVAAAATFFLRV